MGSEPEALFQVEHPDPGRVAQACDRCCGTAWASDGALRVRGWLVYDGASLTGRPLHVRICPTCQSQLSRERRHTTPARRVCRGHPAER